MSNVERNFDWKKILHETKPLKLPLCDLRKITKPKDLGRIFYGCTDEELEYVRKYKKRDYVKEKKREYNKKYFSIEKNKENKRVYYKKYWKENKEKFRQYSKKRYYERKEKGICVYCGKNKAQLGGSWCSECLDKRRKKNASNVLK